MSVTDLSRALVALLLVAGCTTTVTQVQKAPDGSDPAAEDPGEPAAAGEGGATCAKLQIDGFRQAPMGFTLPAARCGNTWNSVAGSGDVRWVTTDLDGDTVPELVVVSDTCEDAVGTSRWDVYKASATGFAAKPRAFRIPAPRCERSFDAVASPATSVRWATIDLSGDGLVDLVVTSDECDPTVGVTHWDLYEGSADGFAAAPRAYALPAARCDVPFDSVAGAGRGVTYSLLSLAGGKGVDLVVTSDSCDPNIGKVRWDVYRAGASGFAKAPSPYGLPTARCGESFDALAQYASAKLSWSTLDLSGDGRLDLVVTSDGCDADVSKKHWDVYRGGEAAFEKAPAPFTLPAARCGAAYATTASTGLGKLSWSLLDLGGGHAPELLVTSDGCDADVGKKRWDAYAWSESGFAASPRSIAVPAPRCDRPFSEVAGTGPLTYGLFPLTAACVSQLVVTSDGCDTDVGKKRWDVY